MSETKIMITCDGQIMQTGYCNKCGHVAMTSSCYCGRLIEVFTINKAMSEAEKKWNDWDDYQNDAEKYFLTCSERSREAYKAALRREIEKRLAEWRNNSKGTSVKLYDHTALFSVNELKELLDTVEP